MKNVVDLRVKMEKCQMKINEGEWQDGYDIHMLRDAGVYAIIDEDNNVVYIGETTCLIRRLGEHTKITSTIPVRLMYRFVVLAYETDYNKRLKLEKEYTTKYQPGYSRPRLDLKQFIRQRDSHTNKYKTRDLRKRGLLHDTHDPYPAVEEYNDAVEDELKFLNTNTED